MPPKRNTTLANKKDRSDEEYPDYQNLTEVAVTLNCKQVVITKIQEAILAWAEKTHPDIDWLKVNFKTNATKNLFVPLWPTLRQDSESLFRDREAPFVTTTLEYIATRSLSNHRRREKTANKKRREGELPEEEVSRGEKRTKTNSESSVSRAETPASFGRSNTIQPLPALNDPEELMLEGKTDDDIVAGRVSDVRKHTTPKLAEDLSIAKWHQMIVEDLDLASTNEIRSITYHYVDREAKIRVDRHFAAAIFDAYGRGKRKVIFYIEILKAAGTGSHVSAPASGLPAPPTSSDPSVQSTSSKQNVPKTPSNLGLGLQKTPAHQSSLNPNARPSTPRFETPPSRSSYQAPPGTPKSYTTRPTLGLDTPPCLPGFQPTSSKVQQTTSKVQSQAPKVQSTPPDVPSTRHGLNPSPNAPNPQVCFNPNSESGPRDEQEVSKNDEENREEEEATRNNPDNMILDDDEDSALQDALRNSIGMNKNPDDSGSEFLPDELENEVEFEEIEDVQLTGEGELDTNPTPGEIIESIETGRAPTDYNEVSLRTSVPIQVTEHFTMERWVECCKFFCWDFGRTNNDPVSGKQWKIKIKGLSTPLYPFQLFGVYTMLKFLHFQNGVWNADDMGLGKTIQCIATIAVYRLLALMDEDISDARERQATDEHLAPGTPEKPQEEDAKCPSNNKFGIECGCVDSSMSSHLTSPRGASLILPPWSLVPTWVQQLENHLDMEDSDMAWVLRVGHGSFSSAPYQHTKRFQKGTDLYFIGGEVPEEEQPEEQTSAPETRYEPSRMIVVSTKGSYFKHVSELLFRLEENPNWVNAIKKTRNMTRWRKILLTPVWGLLAVDEAHLERGAGGGTNRILAKHPDAPKVFLTGTPYESTPSHLVHWIDTFCDVEAWIKPRRAHRPWIKWPERTEHRKRLADCIPARISELGKTHSKMVQRPDNWTEEDKNNHVRKLRHLSATLLLGRNADKSKWFNEPLTQVLPNKPRIGPVKLLDEHAIMINSIVKRAAQDAQKRYEKELADWKANPYSVAAEPKLKLGATLNAMRRARILTTFPMLASLESTSKLALTADEDYKKGFYKVRKEAKLPWALSGKRCPYAEHIEEICDPKNNPKINLINKVLDGKVRLESKDPSKGAWLPGEKAIFCLMCPTSALIFYWYLVKIRKAKTILISSAISSQDRQKAVNLLQESPLLLSGRNPDFTMNDVPQYLVGNTRLIAQGYDMTASTKLIQVDPEFLLTDENQAKKRINRIGQTKQTYTYALYATNSTVETAIHSRQDEREMLRLLGLEIGKGDLVDGGRDEEGDNKENPVLLEED